MEAEALEQKSLQLNSLNARQKGASYGSASRTNDQLEENFTMQLFLAWSTEARLDRLIKHYATRMDHKKHQLESVQTMFKTFATQLEQGLGNSPRSRKSKSSNQES